MDAENQVVRRAGSALICAVLILLLLAGPALAGFVVATLNGTNTWATDTLDPPTGLTASRPCSVVTAPAFRSSSAATGSTTTISPARPAGVVAGDLLVAIAVSTDNSNPPTAPAGWTTVSVQTNAHELNAGGAFYRLAGGSEPASYAFGGFDTSDAGAVVIAAYSGADPTTPVEVTGFSNNAQSTTVTAPSVTTTTAPTRLVAGYVVGSRTSLGTPGGMTARVQQATTTPTDVAALYDQVVSATCATGARTVAVTPGVGSIGFSLALRGAAPADPVVTLSWTPTTDTYATGYALVRTGGGTTSTTISGRTTATSTDSTTSAATAYTYSLTAVVGNWSSVAATASVGACV